MAQQEDPRSFAVFISSLSDGLIEHQASENLKKLFETLEEEAITRAKATGKLVITLAFEVDNKGNVNVSHNVERKEPKKFEKGGVCWLTKGANYSLDPPMRRKGIREVERDESAADDGSLQAAPRGSGKSV